MKLRCHLTKTSQRMLPEEALDLEFPQEHRSKCDSCYEVSRGKYKADLKCCTVIPHIPNFMLGMALKDPKTQQNIERVIGLGFVLPEGMQHTPHLFFRAMSMNKEGNFGRDYDMACPFLRSEKDKAFCGIHAYRNANCSTYFCQSNLGLDGSDLWMDVRYLLRYGETHLSGLCLEAIGFDFEAYLQRMENISSLDPMLTLDDATRGFSLAAIRYIWGIDNDFNSLADDEEVRLAAETKRKIIGQLHATADWLEKHDDWSQLIANSKFERPNLSEFSEEPDYEDKDGERYISFEEALALLKTSHSQLTTKLHELTPLQGIKLAPGCQLTTHDDVSNGLWLYKLTNKNEEAVLLNQEEYDTLKLVIENKKNFAELRAEEKEWIRSLILQRFATPALRLV